MRYKLLLTFIVFFFGLKNCAQTDRFDSLFVNAVDAYEKQDYKSAANHYSGVLEELEKKFGKESKVYLDILERLEECNYRMENYNEAIHYNKEFLQLCEKVLGCESQAYVTSLTNLASYYSHLGQYDDAIVIHKEILNLCEKTFGREHSYYISSLNNLIYDYSSNGNYNEAISANKECLELSNKTYGNKNQNCVASLNSLAYLYSCNGNYTEAISIYKELLELHKEILDSSQYIICLNNLANTYSMIGNCTDAITIYQQLLKTQEKFLGREHPDYILNLTKLAVNYSSTFNYKEAINTYKETLDLYKNLLGSEHPDYARTLQDLAVCYSKKGNNNEALQAYEEALFILKKTIGCEHIDYVSCQSNLACCYSDLGNYNKAIQLNKDIIKVRKKILGHEHPDYATSLSNLANNYANAGNYAEAIRLNMETIELRGKILGFEHPDYASSLSNLAICYNDLENYEEAIKLNNEALKIRRKVLGCEHPDYLQSLNNLAICYSNIGNYGEAIRLNKEIIETRRKILGIEHPEYIMSINNLASCYSNIGNYTEAINMMADLLDIYKKTGRENSDYIQILNNRGICYSEIGSYEEAIRTYKESLNICKKIYEKNHPIYIANLMNLAASYCGIGAIDEAIRLNKEILEIIKTKSGKKQEKYALILNNLALCYCMQGNYGKAIQVNNEALAIFKEITGQEHSDYISCLRDIARSYLYNGSYKEFENAWNNYIILHKEKTIDQLQSMTSEDKNSFWSNENETYEYWSPFFAYEYNTPQLLSSAYDASLFSKGLLLGAENETKRIIQNSNDKELLALYDNFVLNKMQLNKFLEKPIKERPIETDSLSKIVEKQERELMSRSKAFGNIKKNMLITWQDVQSKLNDDDIAIEFMSFNLNNDSTMYVALTLKKGYEHPKLTPLFVEKQLNVIRPSRYYKGNGLYNLVWKPVEAELAGVKNVYFSPTGKLYNINIEVLPEIASQNDGRNYYRLSSTRQLAYISEEYETKKEATVYGGLKYSATDDGNQSQKQDSIASSRGVVFQSGWSYLPGTLTEAESVYDAMKSSEIASTLYTGTKGTEESFKSLGGSRQKYLHIATHGFFYTDKDTVSMKNAGFRLLNDEVRNHNVEDKSLTRSGLLLADCNDALTGQPIGYNREDGILYGNEIAQMDLRGLDLLTLSACETGIGDITGEGVFGLQRAFKKAGAQSIVMSLWKVDDDATRIFMTRFYQNYIDKHMSKSAALRAAQQYLREYEVETTGYDGTKTRTRKYDNPIYWAAFIILDPMQASE